MRPAWKIRRVNRNADGEIIGALKPRVMLATMARQMVKEDPEFWEVMSRTEEVTDDDRAIGAQPGWEKYDSLESLARAKKG